MRILVSVLGIAILAPIVYTVAQETYSRRSADIPLVASGPELSGDLSHALWSQGARFGDFELLGGKGRPVAATEVRILAAERALYVGFVCHEPTMDKLVADVTQPGGTVWSDDCVEIMVDPTNAGAFHYHVIINSAGVIWQGFHSVAGVFPRPDGEIGVKTALGADRWMCEVMIPFAWLGTAPGPGDVWGLNVGRERQAGQKEVSSWQAASSFTDPTQLGMVSWPLSPGPIALRARNRGGLSPVFNDLSKNVFAVEVRHDGAAPVPVRLEVLTDDTAIGSVAADVAPGAARTVSASYSAPPDAAGRVFFRAYIGERLHYESILPWLQAAAAPVRTWVVEDPLFDELVGTEPPGLARHGALMWTHALNGRLLRETAKRFAVRYSLEEAYRDFGRYGLIPVGGGRAAGERAEMYERYGIGNLAYLKSRSKDIPWDLDPRAMEQFFERLEDLVANPHPHLWGIFAGDELDCIVLRQGAGLKADPPEGYAYIHAADEEVRSRYGGGKWGIPEGVDDRNPYRWIAYHKWTLERLRERHRRMHAIVKRHAPDLPLVSTDPTSGMYGFEYSLQAPYFDIFTHQYMPRQKRWRQWLGFMTKMLADTTGREVWPCAHVENYGMAPTPEEALEELSQIRRNGGHGFHLYMPDTGNGNNVVGDTRITQFGSPRRHHTVMNIITLNRSLPRLNYPEYRRAAIVYNDDCLQSTYRVANRRYWYLTEACYTFIGPIARSWFQVVDVPQLLSIPSLRERFDVMHLPTARFQQAEVVERLRRFVEAGGTLICGDPKAFETDTIGNDMTAARAALFGVIVGDAIKPSHMTVTAGGGSHDLSVYGRAFALTVTAPDAEVLSRFDTGEPAMTVHRLGAGRAILFASNPYEFRANEDPSWRGFFRAWIAELGAPTGLDIWRFRYPDSAVHRVPERDDHCLTDNHVEWREETPAFPRNLDTGGSYTYSPEPDAWPDHHVDGSIPFAAGKLTDRRASIMAAKTEARWYAPYERPASHWNVRWKRPDPVTITFHLGEPCLPTEARIWFSETLPDVVVEGSSDGQSWHELGRAEGVTADADVLDLAITLGARQTVRHVRLNIDGRGQDQAMTLVETELWGKRPGERGAR